MSKYVGYADELGQWTHHWYGSKNRRKKFWSFVWRTATIVASTAGALAPIVATLKPWGWVIPIEVGYLCALLAVFFLAIDRNFGFTSSWVRTLRAARAVDTALMEFRAATLKLAVKGPDKTLNGEWAQCIHEFLVKLRGIIDQEAETWATEMLANFNQLDRSVAAGVEETRKRYEQAAERLKAGGVELTIKTLPEGPWSCSIFVGGEVVRQDWSNPVCGLADIAPGPAEIKVQATAADGVIWQGSRAVMIPSGAILPVPVDLAPTNASG